MTICGLVDVGGEAEGLCLASRPVHVHTSMGGVQDESAEGSGQEMHDGGLQNVELTVDLSRRSLGISMATSRGGSLA